MYALKNRGNILGQFQPFFTPSLPEAMMPTTPASAAGGGDKAILVVSSMVGGLVMGTSTLFTYGLARDAKSKMVRTTGYILAGLGVISTLAYLIGGPVIAAMSGAKK